jgi:hypothetical protein
VSDSRTKHAASAARLRLALAIALACATAALPRGARAQEAAQAPDTSAAPAAADTGWVEVGGETPFGIDDPFKDLPEDGTAARGEDKARVLPYLDFNRVDALIAGLDHTFKPKAARTWTPGVRFWVARSIGRRVEGPPEDHGMWLYFMSIDQPLLPNRDLVLSLARYRRTQDDGFEQVSAAENVLHALFFKYDWRDWFHTEGWDATLTARWRLHWTASAGFTDRDDVPVVSPGVGAQSAFRRDRAWRENPDADAGNLRAARFALGYDSRTETKPRTGMRHRVEAETAGGSLDGDFAYVRWLGDLRAYVHPAPSHWFKTRVLAGTTSEGDVLPFQRTFAVGGIGTLRATPFRQYRGRHVFLANSDWSWEILRRSSKNAALKTGLSLVLWNDVGLAWDAPRWDLGHQKPAWNAGLGIGTTDETLRVYFGRDVRAKRSPVHVTVRVSQSY